MTSAEDQGLSPGLEALPDWAVSGRINPRSGTVLPPGTRGNSGGPTDTAMLIWMVVREHPGITLDGIFDLIETKIPSGWALRKYGKSSTRRKLETDQRSSLLGQEGVSSQQRRPGRLRLGQDDASSQQWQYEARTRSARRYVLAEILSNGTRSGIYSREGSPSVGARPSTYRYTVARPLKGYRGDVSKIDMPGSTRAADHLRAAYALQVVEDLNRRMAEMAGRPIREKHVKQDELDAIAELASAYRAKKCLNCGGDLT